jgi:hypothetical protein
MGLVERCCRLSRNPRIPAYAATVVRRLYVLASRDRVSPARISHAIAASTINNKHNLSINTYQRDEYSQHPLELCLLAAIEYAIARLIYQHSRFWH